ncbi:unnamed protein product, partial [Didymodactylos carnosus]
MNKILNISISCYMLLNSASNFQQFYLLKVLISLVHQCNYKQLKQIQQSVQLYNPSSETVSFVHRKHWLNLIEPLIEYSVDEIVPHSYWWKEVESNFFNSLFGVQQYRITNLFIIRNSKLEEQFESIRADINEDRLPFYVYHGSAPECLQQISKTGFKLPQELPDNVEVLDPGFFGNGIYHGFAADYAIQYSEKYKQGSNQIMMSCITS